MRVTLTVLTFILSAVAPLCGQGRREAEDAHLRNSCRLAAQTLTAGNPGPKYDWAVDFISNCDESGPPAVAALWASTPGDTSALERMVRRTQLLRDERILSTLLDVAQDAARPQIVRLSSIRVLISYYAPGHTSSLDNLAYPSQPAFFLAWQTEFLPTDGAHPLSGTSRDRIRAGLRVLASGDPDPVVARASAKVLERLPLN